MATNKKNFVIRGTQQGLGDVRYVKMSNPAFVKVQDADKWTEKQAKQIIEDFVKSGEWKAGAFRAEVMI